MLGKEQINLQEFAKLKKQRLHSMFDSGNTKQKQKHWRHPIPQTDEELLNAEGNKYADQLYYRFMQLLDIKLPFLFGRERYKIIKIIKKDPKEMTLKEKGILAAYLKKLNDFHVAAMKETSKDDEIYWKMVDNLQQCLGQVEGFNEAENRAKKRKRNRGFSDVNDIDRFQSSPYPYNNVIIIDGNNNYNGHHHSHHSHLFSNKAHKIGTDIHKVAGATIKLTNNAIKGIEHVGAGLEHDVCGGGCDSGGEDCCKCCGGCCGISVGGGVMGGAAAGGSTSSGSNSGGDNGGGGNKLHNHHTSSTAQHGSHHGFFGNLQNNAEMIKHGHFFDGWSHTMFHMTWATPFVMIYAAYTFLIVAHNLVLDIRKLVKPSSSRRDRKAAAQDLAFTLLFGTLGFFLGTFGGPHTAILMCLMFARLGRFLSKKWRKHRERKNYDGITKPEKYVPTAARLDELAASFQELENSNSYNDLMNEIDDENDAEKRVMAADMLNAGYHIVRKEKQFITNKSKFRKGDNGCFSTVGHKAINSYRGYHKHFATADRKEGLRNFGLFNKSSSQSNNTDNWNSEVHSMKKFINNYYNGSRNNYSSPNSSTTPNDNYQNTEDDNIYQEDHTTQQSTYYN